MKYAHDPTTLLGVPLQPWGNNTCGFGGRTTTIGAGLQLAA